MVEGTRDPPGIGENIENHQARRRSPEPSRRRSLDSADPASSSDGSISVGASDIQPSLRNVSNAPSRREEEEILALVPFEKSTDAEKRGGSSRQSFVRRKGESANVKSEPAKVVEIVPFNSTALERKVERPSMSHPSMSHSRRTGKSSKSSSTMEKRRGFDHCFVSVPSKERLSVLFATLRRNKSRKVIVFCSTCESAKFHSLLFRQIDLPIHEVHSKLPDGACALAYDTFLYSYPGILFASDIAMREFDIPPNIDYVVQYEPPENPSEYIFRMGDAEAYLTSCHKALLFLSSDNEQEINFLTYFKKEGVSIDELEARRVLVFQERVDKMIRKHDELNKMAWEAFRAYLLAYESNSFKKVFDSHDINRSGIRHSFGHPRLPGSNKEETGIVEGITHGITDMFKKDKKKKKKNRWSPQNHDEEDYRKELSAPITAVEKEHEHKVRAKRSKEDPRKEHGHTNTQWMGDTEKTWRAKPEKKKSWMTRDKSWRHCQVKVQDKK